MNAIHIISLPHTQLTDEYCRCAYTSKCKKLCKMLTKEGMKVYVYASEDSETPAEMVTCITKGEQAGYEHATPADYWHLNWNRALPMWTAFRTRVIAEIAKRIQPGDIIGTFAGLNDEGVKTAFPNNRFVELGIGYNGSFADFRVFESYAWYHATLAAQKGSQDVDGKHYWTVIPNYFDPKEFPYSKAKEKYFLFMGRMIWRKGIKIVADIAERMPRYKFLFAGQGAEQNGNKITCTDGTVLVGDNLKYLGAVGVEERARLMSRAQAVICPTIYLGPFEGVHVEAMMCGTPVLTTDYGAFAETYDHGVHGFKCKTIKQFVESAYKCRDLNGKAIQKYAQSRYSMDVCAKQYVEYFDLLAGLDRGGFYEK